MLETISLNIIGKTIIIKNFVLIFQFNDRFLLQFFRAQRKHQARLVLVPETVMQESIQSYQTYLNSVLGFFIVEDHLLTTGGGLVSRDWLVDLWGMAIAKVASTLQKNTSLVTDPQLMLNIKYQIVLFNMTLK